MKIYRYKRTQFIRTGLDDAWTFFSSPKNLSLITPPYMAFKILRTSGGDQLYAGQIIHYRVNILPGIPVEWVTEITQAQKPDYFVDEQRRGPFLLWQHQHRFAKINGGIEMTDEVNYAVPFSIIGRLANVIFVRNRVNAIFDYRSKVLEDYFTNGKTNFIMSV